MGATASRQVGRVLSDVEHTVTGGSLSDSNEQHLTTNTSFTKWAETCFMDVDPADLFQLISEDTRRAKQKHAVPMNLFPAKEEKKYTGRGSWAPNCSWKPPSQVDVESPLVQVFCDTAMASIVEKVVPNQGAGMSACTRETNILIDAPRGTGVPQSTEAQTLCNIALRIEQIPSLSIEEVFKNVSCGDHIFYVGHELVSMEHHMIVVKKIEYPNIADPTRTKYVVIAAGVMAERWADTTLCYINVGDTINRGTATINRVVATCTGGLHNRVPSAPDVVDFALASIGMSHCWNGSSFNCEDWANWVTTGWAFSLQRMRAVQRQELQGDVLVTPIYNTTMIDVASIMYQVSSEDASPIKLSEFPLNVAALRDVRVDVCKALEKYENF